MLVVDLLNYQQPQGGFDLDANVVNRFEISYDKLLARSDKISVSDKNVTKEYKYQLLCTALVLAFLKIKCISQKALWEAAVEKSMEWFKKEYEGKTITLEGKPLKEWAEQYVNKLA